MAKTTFSQKFKHLLTEPRYPDVGLEINSDAIRIAAISEDGNRISVQHLDAEPLPAGAIDINPLNPNIVNFEAATEALRALWSRSRLKSSRICLLIQDRAAITFSVQLETPPQNAQELLDLTRFKFRKSIPYKIEEANITYFNEDGSTKLPTGNFWAVLIHNSVLQQYESFIESVVGPDTALVDLSTFNLMNLAHHHSVQPEQDDALYINLNRDYLSIAITQRGRLMLFRSRARGNSVLDIEEVIEEIHPATMFYQDKLQGSQLSRVYLYHPGNDDTFLSSLNSSLNMSAEVLSISDFAGSRFDSSNASYLVDYAPLVGMLVSRRGAYV